ncbi:MAG TPA: glycosyltransferase family 4 protein [Candidatus Binatia bacterium]|nr:glycosyltransferase family 4 protein [Candidatus Binatia bacterium]
MKISRVTINLPNEQDPGGGFHAYVLTKEIEEPTLILTRKQKAIFPLPRHAVVKEIPYHNSPFTWSLGNGILRPGALRFKEKVRILLRLVFKLKEVLIFLSRAIPHLLRFKPDVIHVDGLICAPSGIFAKSVLGSRFIITLHSVTEAALVQRYPFLKRLLKYPDKLVCVSDAIKNSLTEAALGVERLEVIPCGVDLELFKPLNLPRKDQLVAVGYLKWQKGYDYLLEAMAALTNFSHYRLLMIGDGPDRSDIERKIESLKLSHRVRLLGMLPQEEIVKHLNESKLFIMSSLVEGLPKVLLEAIACGTPCVLTTACNAEGIIERVGSAVEPANHRALARAIENLLRDEERWNELSRNCLKIAQEYGWDRIAGQTLRLYKGL